MAADCRSTPTPEPTSDRDGVSALKFVSLHHHSTFSYMDGFGTPAQHVARAAELGMSAMALTEHGNVSSHVQLEQAGLKHSVKPIFGLEAYTAPLDMREQKNRRKWHLTLLAMNDAGYRSLMRLVTASWADGFYQWPTISGPMLAEDNEGLIVLSGCADSKLSCDLLGGKGRERGDERDANRTIEAFKSLLGDRYYLECQQFPELDRTRQLNPWFARAAQRHGVSLVGTADVHYPYPDDNEMQVVLHAAGRGSGTVAQAEAEWEYGIRLTHPISDKLIWKRLKGTGLTGAQAEAAVLVSAEIAERCNVELPKVGRLRYPLPAEQDSRELVWEWLRAGWKYRSKLNPRLRSQKKIYVNRLKYEMELVESKDFIDYFLMLSDIVRWAKDHGIPVGPARGSAAASLACYLLRITEIDPLQFPIMLFERFIDVTRSDLPDVDLDFDDERRDELRAYAERKYGVDHVANIGTFTKYRGKNALIDVARVHNIPDYKIKVIKDLVVERSGGDSRIDASLGDTITMFPQAQAVFDEYPMLSKAIRLEGNYRGMGVHAAGLVISNDPLTDNVATYTKMSAGVERSVLSVNKYDAEYLGLMKADFLGLTTMGMLRRALAHIGMSLEELYAVELDDPAVIASFKHNDVTGIFQFGGGATRVVCGDVKPDNFLELCDINALSRPGPLHSGSTNDYIDVKHGRQKAIHLHPAIDALTSTTKFQIIYQEQILQIIKELGGLPWAALNEIRKVISLKKGEGAFNEKRGDFIAGCAARYEIDEELAIKIWNKLVTAGQYAFNAAHCVSYSMLAYWCMWFKVHHPEAFYTASLQKVDDENARYLLLRDAIRHGIKVLPPELERSGITWEAVDGGVLAGFIQVPGVGPKMAEAILAERELGPFSNWEDLQRVKGIGPKMAENIVAMVDSDDPFRIHVVDWLLDDIRSAIKDGDMGPLPIPTHKATDIPTDAQKNLPLVWVGIPRARNPQDVLEDERARSGDDIDVCRERLGLKVGDPVKKMAVVAVDDTDESVYLRFSRRDFPKFERRLWRMRLNRDVVLVRGKRLSMVMGRNIQVQSLWVLRPNGEEEEVQ